MFMVLKPAKYGERPVRWMVLLSCVVWLAGCSLLDRQKEPQITGIRTDRDSLASVGRGHQIQVTLLTSDPDNDELDFLWVASGGTFKKSGRDTLVDLFQDSVTVVWKAPSEVGTYDLTVEVSDGKSGERATSSLRIAVTQRPPLADAGEDRVLAYHDTLRVMLDGSGSSDPDLDELRYLWMQVRGPGVSIQPRESETPSFRAVAPADYVFTLRVRDDILDAAGALTSDPDTVIVRVSDRGGRSG